MKTTAKPTMKEKVEKYLIKQGHNKEMSERLVNSDGFKFAEKNYLTPSKIADCLMRL